MERIKPTIFVTLAPLFLAAAVYAASVPALRSMPMPQFTRASMPLQSTIVNGTVTYRAVRVLPPDARITVQLLDISTAAGTESVLGEQVITSASRSVPFPFEVGYDPASIRPDGAYVVRATVVAGGQLLYEATTNLGAITQGHPTTAQLFLARVAPWSPFEVALSSGRLAHYSY